MRNSEQEGPDKETKELANSISNWVNRHSKRDFPSLMQLLAQDHRTLQQKFTAVCLAWFVHLATLEDYWFDLRNQASRDIAKKIVANVEEVKWGLPLI